MNIQPISKDEAENAIEVLETLYHATHSLTAEQEMAILTAQDALRMFLQHADTGNLSTSDDVC